MKTVKERLDELFYEYGINNQREITLQTKQVRELVSHSFEQGGNFYQRWIPVEEKLPNGILTDKKVLVKYQYGDSLVVAIGCYSCFENWIVPTCCYEGEPEVKFWRPIEIKENND